MKKHRLFENLTFVFVLNIVQLLTTYYQCRAGGEYRLSDIIFSIIFSVLYSWFFVNVFFNNKSPFSEGAIKLRNAESKYLPLIKFILLLLLKGALDVGLNYIADISVVWKYIGTDILIVAYMLVVYFVAIPPYAWKGKEKKRLFYALVPIVLAVSISICFGVHLVQQYNFANLKYTLESPYLIRVCKNLDFLNSVKFFILDTVIICVLTIVHTLSGADGEKSKYEQRNSGFRTFIRCNFLGFLIVMLFVAKMGVDPEAILVHNESESGISVNYETDGPFNLSPVEKWVLHGMVEYTNENAYFYAEELSLQKNNAVEQFTLNGQEPNTVFTDIGTASPRYVCFNIDGQKVYLYGYYAVCYYEGKSPRIVRMESLNQCEEIPVVTELCKHLIENGNLFAFEYAGGYLEQYAPGFIQPYIERYCEGIFNEVESRWIANTHYRNEYIMDCAKKLA